VDSPFVGTLQEDQFWGNKTGIKMTVSVYLFGHIALRFERLVSSPPQTETTRQTKPETSNVLT
jgi:hypothetical protein